MANLKKFLIPMATAIASLTANSSHATVNPQTVAPEATTAHTAPSLSAVSQAHVQRVVFATGSEFHALLLARTEHGTILAGHQSHVSHRSHASHRSHYSGY